MRNSVKADQLVTLQQGSKKSMLSRFFLLSADSKTVLCDGGVLVVDNPIATEDDCSMKKPF